MALLIASSWEPGEAFLVQDDGHTDRAYFASFAFEHSADIVNGEVLFSQCNHVFPDLVLFGGHLGSP